MSVLIKGMEMPDTCTRCDYIGLNVAIGCKVVTGTNGRTDNCPLIEIPEPRGRLIDADKLMKRMWDETDCMISVPATFVRDAPTVIPASEEAE